MKDSVLDLPHRRILKSNPLAVEHNVTFTPDINDRCDPKRNTWAIGAAGYGTPEQLFQAPIWHQHLLHCEPECNPAIAWVRNRGGAVTGIIPFYRGILS